MSPVQVPVLLNNQSKDFKSFNGGHKEAIGVGFNGTQFNRQQVFAL